MTADAAPYPTAASTGVSAGTEEPRLHPVPWSNEPPVHYYRSPRTAEQPMAFTTWEFVRGALLAFATFVALALATLVALGLISAAVTLDPTGITFLPVVLVVAPMYLAPWALGATVGAGAPLGWLLGQSLRRVGRRRIHIALFAALGAMVGLATTTVFLLLDVPAGGLGGQVWVLALFTALAAAAVVYGWWRTASWALRDDARHGVGAVPSGVVPAATCPPQSAAPPYPSTDLPPCLPG